MKLSIFTRAAALAALAIVGAPALAEEAQTETLAAAVVAVPSGSVLMADKLVVRKSTRRLYAMREGRILREFKVALGLRPSGHKEREGDFRTPEGSYKLIRRNPRSDFFLSMEISYPNSTDLAHAQRLGVRPGGAIMLHGWPNTPRKTADYYKSADWTDGCIAVSNSDMVEIWLMTPIETPIEILP
ncbi:MAG TPA: L,D-transpeptidase family protein [Steroidobacteraceae bacterium]|nr:L,D-transpeptidase family protein [Steroidobacteraceae bacterium]